ncbi:MAG: porin family protein [Gammaproteobacteria bacterium]|nr:porin family protein [Gammaproteobacteria bacterium]
MKKLNKVIGSAALIASAIVMTSAHADSGFYIGASAGNASISGEPSTSIDFDSDDTGYKVFGGFKFTLLAIEASYVDFGKPEQNNISVELSGYDLFGLVNIGIGPVDLFGKVGVFSWDSDLTNGASVNEDGTDPVYGIGAGLSFGSISVRAEYEYFDISDFDTVEMISVGASLTF